MTNFGPNQRFPGKILIKVALRNILDRLALRFLVIIILCSVILWSIILRSAILCSILRLKYLSSTWAVARVGGNSVGKPGTNPVVVDAAARPLRKIIFVFITFGLQTNFIRFVFLMYRFNCIFPDENRWNILEEKEIYLVKLKKTDV